MKRAIAGWFCGMTLFLWGLPRLEADDLGGLDATEPEMAVKEVRLDPVRFVTPVALTLLYRVEKPLKVNDGAPRMVQIGSRRLKAKTGGAPFEAFVRPGDIQDGSLQVTTEYFVCESHPDAPCWLRKVNFVVPVAKRGAKSRKLELQTPEFPPQTPPEERQIEVITD